MREEAVSAKGSSKGWEDAEKEADKKDRKRERDAMMLETHHSLIRRAELLLLLVIVLGPYEWVTFYHAVRLNGDWAPLAVLLLLRYLFLTPSLLALIAYLRSNPPTRRSDSKLAASLLIALPSLYLIVLAFLVDGKQAIICPLQTLGDIPPCEGVKLLSPPPPDAPHASPVGPPLAPPPLNYSSPPPLPPAPPPLPPLAPLEEIGGQMHLLCVAGHLDGVLYCHSFPFDYLSLVGIVHSIYHYTVELGAVLRRQSLVVATVGLSIAYVVTFLARVAALYGLESSRFRQGALPQVLDSALWIPRDLP